MTTIYVQFSDATESTIVSYFAAPGDISVYPNQGTVDTSDERWFTYLSQFPARWRDSFPAYDGALTYPASA